MCTTPKVRECYCVLQERFRLQAIVAERIRRESARNALILRTQSLRFWGVPKAHAFGTASEEGLKVPLK